MSTPRSLVTDPFTTNLVRIKAAKLCRRADFSSSDQEDVEQSILAYLKEKEHRVDLTRGSVEAFATHLVKTWIRMELRFRGRQRRLGNLMAVSLEQTFVEVDGDEEPLRTVVDPRDQQRRTQESRPCPLERIDVVDAVRHAFTRLSPEEQELLVYVSEHGVAAAAREWSRRSKKRVSRRAIDERVSQKLAITSPPYNIGKEYERQTDLRAYLGEVRPVLEQLARVIADDGSLCWQVGNFVDAGEVFPLDIFYYPIIRELGFKLRNRIVWHFDHGLHASKRFSGRYEVMLWFTKGDEYTFNLDPVRVPSKYPGKTNFKAGPKYGLPSGNPLGKNPSDIWRLIVQEWEAGLWNIPNVKANHPEKTIHPCQFPIELVERCVLALTNPGDAVLDPYSGSGSAMLAAMRHDRRAIGCDRDDEYLAVARRRIEQFCAGTLPYRPLGKPVHQPTGREKVAQRPAEWGNA